MIDPPIVVDEQPAEIIPENLPKEVRATVETFMAMSMQNMSAVDKVADKLTPEHITQLLKNSENDDSRSFSAYKLDKYIGLIIFLLSLGFAGFLLLMFKDSTHFETVLTGIFSFLGGLGFGRYLTPKKNS